MHRFQSFFSIPAATARGTVETAFVRSALEAMGELAAPVQIPEPFAIFGVAEMPETVLMYLHEIVQIRLFTGLCW